MAAHLQNALISARRHTVVVTVTIAAGVAAAVAVSLSLESRYQAAASFTLVRTKPGLQLSSIMARRVRRVAQRVPAGKSATVEVLARTGDPVVRVYAIGTTPEAAQGLANEYAVELLALDRRVGRRRIDKADFAAAADAGRIDGPEPARHALGGLAISALFALALARLLDHLPVHLRRGRRADRSRA